MALMSIDLGTSSVKVTCYDEESGKVLGIGTESYRLITEKQGWVEQDPKEWWKATVKAIQKCLSNPQISPKEIQGIGLSGQMCGVIPVNQFGEPLYNCITYLDNRCVEEIEILKSREKELMQSAMNPVGNLLSAPKLLWIKRNLKSVWEQTHKWLLPKDFIRLKLTDTFGTDISDASGTLLFDYQTKQWNHDVISELELDITKFPTISNSHDVIGYITTSASKETGLINGIPVVAGGADMACTALGTQAINEGNISVTIGTAGHVIAPTTSTNPEYADKFYQFCHAIPGMYYSFGAIFSGGLSLSWFKDIVGGNLARDPYEVLNSEVENSRPGSHGLFFQPFLIGSGVPYSNEKAKGSFIGLSVRHTRGDLARSVMEGVSYNFKQIIDVLENEGMTINQIYIGEGGSKSKVWTEILTNVLNRNTTKLMENKDSAPLGAAILAGVGIGIYKDFNTAVSKLTSYTLVESTPNLVEVYKNYFQTYEKIYPSLEHIFNEIHEKEAN